MNNFVWLLSVLFFSGCATISGLTGKELIEKDMNRRQSKGAMAICIKGNALLYGGGKVVYARAARNFKGTLVVKDCDVKITNNKIETDPLDTLAEEIVEAWELIK